MRSFEQLSGDTQLHPKIRRMHDYWLAKRAGRLMPSRADVDLLELRDCLGNLCLVDVTSDVPPRFRFRLDGSNLVLATGFDMTGKFLDQRDHFLWIRLSNYLQKRRLSANVGQPTKIADLFGHVVERE